MRKIIFLVLALLTLLVAGCGDPTPKEEAEQINQKFFVEGFQNVVDESHKKYMEIEKQYGKTREADKALSKSDVPKKIADFTNTVKNIEVKNKEVLPLKEKLYALVNNFNSMFIAIQNEDKAQLDACNNAVNKLGFDYKNELAKITTGKPLPVMNTPNGQLYAYIASDVYFAISDISTPATLGNSFISERPQGKFVVIKIIAYNNQKDAVTIDSNCFKLIDKNKREFSTSVPGMSAIQISGGHTKGFLSQVNPTMSLEAEYVFDIPANAKISDFTLQASGGMTGSKVDIPVRVAKTGY